VHKTVLLDFLQELADREQILCCSFI